MMLAVAGTMPVHAQISVSVRSHFSDLDQYGEWMHVQGYGTVWRPYAEEGWRPFTYGHWVHTGRGWHWDSDEPFGWIVCHYGNWYNDQELGWIWVPGYDWSPARVQWSVTDGEIAWAPLPPPMIGHRYPRPMRVEWMSVPAPMFMATDIRSHLDIRIGPFRAEGGVHVYSAPPRMEFVRKVVREPIVTVIPNRVRETRGGRGFDRVEIVNQARPTVVVPVGPKFRREERFEDRPVGERKVIIEQGSRPQVHPAETENRVGRANEPGAAAKVRVETKVESKQEHDADHDHDKHDADRDDNRHDNRDRDRRDNDQR